MKLLKNIFVSLVCAVNIANTVGYTYLHNKSDKNDMMSDSVTATTESVAIENSTEATQSTTEITTTDIPTENTQQATEPITIENSTGLTELCYIENYDDQKRTSLCYDSYNNRIYFKNGYYNISYYDLQSNETVTALDTTESEKIIYEFTVNPYDGKAYAFVNGGLYDIETKQIIDEIEYSPKYYSTFISENELIYGNHKIYLDGSKESETGGLPKFDNYSYDHFDYYVPFNYNGHSYYILKEDWNNYIVKVPNIFTRTGSYSEFTEIEPILKDVFVCDNLIYYLGEDSKIYLYDMTTGKSEVVFDDSVYSEVKISDLVKIDDDRFAIFDLNTYSLIIVER